MAFKMNGDRRGLGCAAAELGEFPWLAQLATVSISPTLLGLTGL